jgi:hypothetical protein
VRAGLDANYGDDHSFAIYPRAEMKGISYELRDAVREAEANDAGPFMPSLSVRQSVDLEDGVMWAAHRRMVHEFRFGRRSKIHGYIVAPEKLGLVLVEKKLLARQMHEAGIKADQETAERISGAAVSIQLGLSELLKNRPRLAQLELDEPTQFEEKTTIGCGPRAWRGFSANYYQRGADTLTANALLVVQKQLCIGAIATSLADLGDRPINTRPLLGDPHIALIMRHSPLSARKLMDVQERLEKLVPPSIQLKDPVIDLQLSPYDQPQALQLWHREPDQGILRLAA